MPRPFRSLLSLCSLVVASCGGAFDRGDDSAAGQTSNGRACEYERMFYGDGDSFPGVDGCSTCSCDDGEVSCVTSSCDSCKTLEFIWGISIADAKRCDPMAGAAACSLPVDAGLTCPCGTFVNPSQDYAIGNLARVQEMFQEETCAGPIGCGPCDPPTSAVCSPEGTCVDM